MDGRPISTAPRDGTRILAWIENPSGGGWHVVHRHDAGAASRNPSHHYECWVTDTGTPAIPDPTRWLPLPQPPRGTSDR